MAAQLVRDKNVIKIDFKEGFNTVYHHRHFEIRLAGTQICFYEVCGKSEYNLDKDTVRWLMSNSRLPRIMILKRAVKGDKSIFK